MGDDPKVPVPKQPVHPPIRCPDCRAQLKRPERVMAGYSKGICDLHKVVYVKTPAFDFTKITPPANRDPNSQAAAASIVHVAPGKRREVYLLVQEHGPVATWQLEDLTGWSHETVSARVYELHNMGAIRRVGSNLTPSGRKAHTYLAVADPVE
jgi:hypothetical protein